MRSSLFLLLCGLLFLSPAFGQKEKLNKLIPAEPIGWVLDFENVFTESQIQILDSTILHHVKETGNEIAIVTLDLDSLDIGSLDEFEELSLILFNRWGIGKKMLNNGVAIIFARKLRMFRIEVGDGLTSKLTDKEAQSIIDTIIIPNFKKSDYYQGTLNGLLEIVREVGQK